MDRRALIITAFVALLIAIVGSVLFSFGMKKENDLSATPAIGLVQDASGDNEAAWKTYQNEEYGFEIQYPSEWSIDTERSTANEVVFDTGYPESREAISFERNVKNISASDWVEMNRKKHEDVILSESEVVVAGVGAYKIKTGEFAQSYIVFSTPEFLYVITTMGLIVENGLLERMKLSDWKTYRNEEYGFAFSMPSSWSIETTTTPAVFYLKSGSFKPVLLGRAATGSPYYSSGEIQVEIFDNPENLSIQKRYLQFDDIYRTYIDNPELPYIQKKIKDYDLLSFRVHRGFGLNLDSDEYQTVKMLKIKNKILHLDYISQDKPDPRIERILEVVVSSVSDVTMDVN